MTNLGAKDSKYQRLITQTNEEIFQLALPEKYRDAAGTSF
jgi:hypothetical protein